MPFQSARFLIFLPCVAALLFLVPRRLRPPLLLIASYLFYISWRPAHLAVLLGTTLVAFVCARGIGASPVPSRRRRWLVLAALAGVGSLAGLKYLAFFRAEAARLLGLAGPAEAASAAMPLVPIGLSFFTLQALGYVIDVHRRTVPEERNPGLFALFVAFFPQVTSGPIGRAAHVIPQLHAAARPDLDRILTGARLMLWGYFKKLAVADRLAVLVDRVYGSPAEYSGLPLVVATYLFAIQIYCDFSGYTDMARGAARVLGYELGPNFRSPYFSRSIPEFWHRWHISLSTWFRDYLYVPLGGNRVSAARWSGNILVVFLASALWHGTGLTFLVWGGLHGILMIASRLTWRLRDRVWRGAGPLRDVWGGLVTFHVVCAAWVFFRARDLSDAAYVLGHIFATSKGSLAAPGFGLDAALAAAAGIGAVVAVDFLDARVGAGRLLGRTPLWVRWPVYVLVFFGVVLLGAFGQPEFIYFRF